MLTICELGPPHHWDVERVSGADGDEGHEAADQWRESLQI